MTDPVNPTDPATLNGTVTLPAAGGSHSAAATGLSLSATDIQSITAVATILKPPGSATSLATSHGSRDESATHSIVKTVVMGSFAGYAPSHATAGLLGYGQG